MLPKILYTLFHKISTTNERLIIMLKRVAAIHDISCFGKCSLTVALPLISSAGIECAVIPTAVLSTHTGGFFGYTFRDLTEDILPIANHWKKENLEFDAVYTGYLGSVEQVDVVCRAIDTFKSDKTLLIVDPVMADHGRLYGGFSDNFPKEMVRLCKKADIITPNITEAAFMTDMPYCEAPHTKEYIENLIKSLQKITDAKIVLTGVCFDTNEIGVACFDGKSTEYVFTPRVNAAYHGTGDIFSSTLTSALLKGNSLKNSALIAAKFTSQCIKNTKENHPEMQYSVNFEPEIPYLLKLLEIN